MGRLENAGEEENSTGKNKMTKSEKYPRLKEIGRVGKREE